MFIPLATEAEADLLRITLLLLLLGGGLDLHVLGHVGWLDVSLCFVVVVARMVLKIAVASNEVVSEM